jgi:hypothetical protein
LSLIKSIKSLGGTSFSKYPLDPATYRGLMGEFFLPGGQGPVERFIYSDLSSCVAAYESCPPLTAIINKKASSYTNGKTWVMDLKGKESSSPYAVKIRERLSKPNPVQTWKQFEAQQKIFVDAFGFSILLPIMPVGYKQVIDCSSMWNIPPNMLEIKESDKLFYQTDLAGMIDKITLCYKGERTDITGKPMFIFKDFIPSFHSMIFPDSRIKSNARPISNIIGALESRGVLINYRGALGILSSQNDKSGYIPIKDKDKKELQADFQRYGLRDQQWKFIITSAAVQWQQMGIPTKDLMLFEEIEDDVNMLTDSWGYPIDLMAGSQRKTYQNAPEAGKSLYQDTIIPEADNLYDTWNVVFDTANNKCRLEKDYSHVSVLQENKGEQATARKTLGEALIYEFDNNFITYNMVLERLGEDTISGMDKYKRELLNDPNFAPPVVQPINNNLNNDQTG